MDHGGSYVLALTCSPLVLESLGCGKEEVNNLSLLQSVFKIPMMQTYAPGEDLGQPCCVQQEAVSEHSGEKAE